MKRGRSENNRAKGEGDHTKKPQVLSKTRTFHVGVPPRPFTINIKDFNEIRDQIEYNFNKWWCSRRDDLVYDDDDEERWKNEGPGILANRLTAFSRFDPEPFERSNIYNYEDFSVSRCHELIKIMKKNSTHKDGRIRLLIVPPMDYLPGQEPRLDALETLVLDSYDVMDIGNISSWIENMSNLKNLFLLNDCNHFPQEAGNLVRLRKLHIQNLDPKSDPLPHFYNFIWQMRSLTTLQLEITLGGPKNTRGLPDLIGNLIHLEQLSLRDSNFSSIPSSIGKLKKLKVLDLGGTTDIDTLPDQLGELVCLEGLDLEESGVEMVPASISRLKNLKWLRHSGFLFNLDLKKLVITNFYPIPPWFGNFEMIRTVDISGRYSYLPPEIGNLVTLEHLSVEDTEIDRLPKSIGKLKNLKKLRLISNDKLKSLPVEIRQLKQLVDINLEGQRLIAGLPLVIYHFFQNCSNLEALNVSRCELSEIIPTSVVPKKLQFFLIQGNPITLLTNKHLSDLVTTSTVLGHLGRDAKGLKYKGLADKMRLNRAMTRVMSSIGGNQGNGAVSLALWAPILFRARASFASCREPLPFIFGKYDKYDICEQDFPDQEDAMYLLLRECFVNCVDRR